MHLLNEKMPLIFSLVFWVNKSKLSELLLKKAKISDLRKQDIILLYPLVNAS